MPIMEKLETRGVPVHIFTDDIEDQARTQLVELAESGIAVEFVAAMPDVHWGMGATIGSVFASDEWICPNAVGVDIGCGVAALPIPGLHKEDLSVKDLERLHAQIKTCIPTGFAMHEHPRHEAATTMAVERFAGISPWLAAEIGEKTWRQLGTLGGGNHFIELTHDETGMIWILLHSGSRNIGKVTADHHNRVAMGQGTTHAQRVDGLNVLMIESAEGQDYLRDMTWCQGYAFDNRQIMLRIMDDLLYVHTGERADWGAGVNIHHNYCVREGNHWITRKGATYAGKDHLGIVPGSMGAGSFIVKGLGNPLSWNSCSHGAGRRMGRNAAMSAISQADFEASMAGIVSETVPELRDEAPGAYKDLSKVMQHQSDLVVPVRRLLPILNVKGIDSGHRKKKKAAADVR